MAQVLAAEQPIPLGKQTLTVWKTINVFLLLLPAAAILSIPFLAGVSPTILFGMLACVLVWVFGVSVSRFRPIELSASGGVLRQALTTTSVVMIGVFFYAMAIVPRINSGSYGAREVAVSIRRNLPANATLWVQEGEYRPFWYYLEPDVKYFGNRSDVASDATYFVLPKDGVVKFTQDFGRDGWQFDALHEVADNEQRKFVVLRCSERQ